MYENAFQYAQMVYALSIAFILFVMVSLVLALVTMQVPAVATTRRGGGLHDCHTHGHWAVRVPMYFALDRHRVSLFP